MSYKPPQADSPESYDHVCTLQSCHGAVVAPLSDVPQEGSSVFSLFSLIKLHLASLPLASSYSRVAVSSVFWAQNIYFSAQTRGAPLRGSSRVPRRRPFMKPPYAIGSVPSLSGHAIAYRWRYCGGQTMGTSFGLTPPNSYATHICPVCCVARRDFDLIEAEKPAAFRPLSRTPA